MISISNVFLNQTNPIGNSLFFPLVSVGMVYNYWLSGLWGAGFGLMFLSLGKTATGAVVVLTISMGLTAGVFNDLFSNHSDLAPNFADLLLSISSGLATISLFLAPLVTGLVVHDETSRICWIYAFYIAVAIMFVTNLVFVLFGSTDEQSWNTPKNDVRGVVD